MELNLKSKKQLTDDASEQIIQLILDNNMQPGERLPNEANLAKMLGIGRSTLREAVRSLESRNILNVRQGSGTYVSDKRGIPEDPLGLVFMYGKDGGVELALELMEVRLLLEPEIASMAAARITPEQEKKLLRLHEMVLAKTYSKDDYTDHLKAETAYHGYIAECSGNGVVKNLIPIINSSISLAITTWDAELREAVTKEHTVLTRAICRHDALGAKFAMIAHLTRSREFYIAAKAEKERAQEIKYLKKNCN